jgi:hypothetical protein
MQHKRIGSGSEMSRLSTRITTVFIMESVRQFRVSNSSSSSSTSFSFTNRTSWHALVPRSSLASPKIGGTVRDDIAYIHYANGISTRIPNIRDVQWYSQHHIMHVVEIKELCSLVSKLHGPNLSNGTISEVRTTYGANRLPSQNRSMVLGLLGSPLLPRLWTTMSNISIHESPRSPRLQANSRFSRLQDGAAFSVSVSTLELHDSALWMI